MSGGRASGLASGTFGDSKVNSQFATCGLKTRGCRPSILAAAIFPLDDMRSALVCLSPQKQASDSQARSRGANSGCAFGDGHHKKSQMDTQSPLRSKMLTSKGKKELREMQSDPGGTALMRPGNLDTHSSASFRKKSVVLKCKPSFHRLFFSFPRAAIFAFYHSVVAYGGIVSLRAITASLNIILGLRPLKRDVHALLRVGRHEYLAALPAVSQVGKQYSPSDGRRPESASIDQFHLRMELNFYDIVRQLKALFPSWICCESWGWNLGPVAAVPVSCGLGGEQNC